jgi:leucyl/phenylalanyl-tRNA--protein transferase
MTIYLEQLNDDLNFFPNVEKALTDPDGLLAMGGDLNPPRILNAYRRGIFPWFSLDEPILWWSPSERAVISAGDVHISKSMKRAIKKQNLSITVNHCFSDVIHACAAPRDGQPGTWILAEMIDAYISLHQLGIAHSIEIWKDKILVGGLYGICVGQTFCGESMFSLENNSSKMAFIALNQHFKLFGGQFIDCQMQTKHLSSLGVNAISRQTFIELLAKTKDKKLLQNCWQQQSISIKLD